MEKVKFCACSPCVSLKLVCWGDEQGVAIGTAKGEGIQQRGAMDIVLQTGAPTTNCVKRGVGTTIECGSIRLEPGTKRPGGETCLLAQTRD